MQYNIEKIRDWCFPVKKKSREKFLSMDWWKLFEVEEMHKYYCYFIDYTEYLMK